MTGPLREWWERILGFARGNRADGDFEAELAAHMEMAVEDNLRKGMSLREARRVAGLQFGSRLSALEGAREQRGLPWLESFFQDLSYAFRGMRKSPAFTSVVVLTLALGIGANTALFSLVEAVLLRPLPVRDPSNLYFLVNAGAKGPNGSPPYECYELFRDKTHSFQSMAAFTADNLTVNISGQVEQVWGESVSGSYFDVLGVRPALGRVLTAADDRMQPPVAVLSYGWWRSRFGGDPAVIGQTLAIGQKQFTIVGVAEPRFTGMVPGLSSGITVPITSLDPKLLKGANWFIDVVARIKPGVTPARARAELEPIFQGFMQPLTDLATDIRRDYFDHMEVTPASKGKDTLRGQFAQPLMILMVVVAVVLLVGCSNLANLFMARAGSRQKEFAVRLAIGAGRMRLARQLLTETMLLFACGTALGLFLATWGSTLVAGFLAAGRTPLFIDPHLNFPVLSFAAAISLLTGLLFGVAPTLASAHADPQAAMHGVGRAASDSRSRTAARQILVVAQVALSLILLVGGGLFVRTLSNLNSLDLGFRQKGVLTMRVLPTGRGYTDARLGALWSELLRRVCAMPGVRTASVSELTPLSGRDRGVRAVIPGFNPGQGLDQLVTQNHVSDGYFETFGIPLLAGRTFTTADRAGAPDVAVINQAAARFYFPGRNPLGATVEVGQGAQHRVFTVVGVVGDARHMNLRQQVPRFLYIPAAQQRNRLTRMSLAVQSGVDPAHLMAALQREVRAQGPDLLVTEVLTLKEQVNAALLQERLLSTLGGFFGGLALLLAAVGLYGLLTHVVGRRTGEIGVRMALGADRVAVVWMILRRSLWLVAIGLAVGVPAALLATRPLAALLYGLAPADPGTIAFGVLMLVVTALVASYIPAYRASRIDPVTALRNE